MTILSLDIKNLAVIEKTHINFDKGLTVITGETGAGKSVILKAIALIMGTRADNNLIRHGQDSCDVCAEFKIHEFNTIKTWLHERDLADEDNCVIRRVIKKDKGSKTYINGYSVNLALLKELGRQLIDMYGQHEHQQLLHKSYQAQIIDDLCKQQDLNHSSCLLHIDTLFKKIKTLKTRMSESQANANEMASKFDLLTFQARELEELNVSNGEFEDISNEYSRLSHAKELLDGFKEVQFDLSDNDNSNIESLLGRSLEKVESLMKFDSELKNSVELLRDALANTQEVINQLRSASDRTDIDSERLNYAEQRINSLITIARKHQCSENELGTLFERINSDLEILSQQMLSPEELDEEINKLSNQYQKLANRCSIARTKAAKKLETHITKQMQLLGMEGGFFQINNTKLSLDNMTKSGLDDIEFLVSGNPGMPAQTLNKVISGGELSRISLAIQILGGSICSAPTLIFDEIDVGVGGGTAEIVGNHLRELAKNYQILCITHLPQVASKGMQHLNVKKNTQSSTNNTTTNIQTLNNDQRINEIARMLGGINITENTIAHAKEMLKVL